MHWKWNGLHLPKAFGFRGGGNDEAKKNVLSLIYGF